MLKDFSLKKALLILLIVAIGVVISRLWQTKPAPYLTATTKTGQIILEDKSALPSIAENYRKEVELALSKSPPILNLLNLSSDQKSALDLALSDQRFLSFVADAASHTTYRNEIFSVEPLSPGEISKMPLCKGSTCYRIELFNFTRNLSTIAIANLNRKTVHSVQHLSDSQPEIPEHLVQIATAIAAHSPAVLKALGKTPDQGEFIMASTKTALNGTRCERSLHLCVAPTFVDGNRALWTIVDLTDPRVVGTRWTEWGDPPVTEGQLIDQVVSAELCRKDNDLTRNGWSFKYSLTGSDGIEVREVSFRGKASLRSAKNVDWHVSYSGVEGFGYSDAIGCPRFSTAAVIPATLPKIKDLDAGFELIQGFHSKRWPLPCNYFYEQRFVFNDDGSFRVAVANRGRGCGENGTYRPVVRIALPIEFDIFEEWNGSDWVRWEKEGWRLQTAATLYNEQGFQYRIRNKAGEGYYLEPGRGQFGDGGRGDNALLYVTRYDQERDEGESDLLTIGPCCNVDEKQGPEKFIDNEDLSDSPFTLWYVPQMKNDGKSGSEYCWASSSIEQGKSVVKEFPCYAGPRFVPISIDRQK